MAKPWVGEAWRLDWAGAELLLLLLPLPVRAWEFAEAVGSERSRESVGLIAEQRVEAEFDLARARAEVVVSPRSRGSKISLLMKISNLTLVWIFFLLYSSKKLTFFGISKSKILAAEFSWFAVEVWAFCWKMIIILKFQQCFENLQKLPFQFLCGHCLRGKRRWLCDARYWGGQNLSWLGMMGRHFWPAAGEFRLRNKSREGLFWSFFRRSSFRKFYITSQNRLFISMSTRPYNSIVFQLKNTKLNKSWSSQWQLGNHKVLKLCEQIVQK